MEISNNLLNDIIPLIYDDIDTSKFKNIILIHDEVQDYNMFIQSANLDSYPIIYNSSSSKDDLKNLLRDKFSNIERIALVFHNPGIDKVKKFIDNEPLFTDEDLNGTLHKYSNNLKFIIDLVKDFNIKSLDYLACNTLQYNHWNKYYNIIHKETNVIIGASNNLTGNIKYGGDWVLESINTDIKNIYFTDGIDNYQYTLATTITTSTTINQSDIDSYVWPVIITGGTLANRVVITFGENLTITGSTNNYFRLTSQYITIDGNNKIITIDGIADYPGLLRSGSDVNNGFTNISIYNLGIEISNSATLSDNGGWICQSFFSRGINSGNITVTNCYSIGEIGAAGGGILGSNTGILATGGTITISTCYSIGSIGQSGGGIIGRFSGKFSSGLTISISYCYSDGNIDNDGGGIVGGDSGDSSTGITISSSNCYSSGSIGKDGGGIFGSNTGISITGGIINAVNCYTIGSIESSAGGIYGSSNNGGTSSYCIYVGGSTSDVTPDPTQTANVWVDNNATLTIKRNDITPSNWIDYSSNTNVPWLLSTFNDTIYNPNTQTLIYGTSGISDPGLFYTDYTYLIFLIDPTTSYITINTSTGILTFLNTLSAGTYIINVLVGKINSNIYYSYNSNIYTLIVDKSNQIITFDSIPNKVYNDPPFNLTASSSSGLSITYTSSDTNVSTISGNTVTIVGVGNSIIIASQVGNNNYYPALDVPQNLTVNKASQTITFNTLSDKIYGDDPFNLNATSTSGLSITYTSSNIFVAIVSGSIVTIIGVGSTLITASQSGNNNYLSATNVSQSLTVNKKNQTITFNTLLVSTYGCPPFNLSATSSSGLTITYNSSDTSVAIISGNTVTIVGAGTSIITASQSGSSIYNPATNVSQNLTINKKNQTITFDTLPSKIFGEPPFNLTAITTSNLIISYISSNINVAVISDNTVIIIGVGTTLITASQSGNSNYNFAANVYQNLIINYGGYNIQLNSPQLAYNENIKKYYSTVIKTNNLNSKKIQDYNKSSYTRIFYPDESITYP